MSNLSNYAYEGEYMFKFGMDPIPDDISNEQKEPNRNGFENWLLRDMYYMDDPATIPEYYLNRLVSEFKEGDLEWMYAMDELQYRSLGYRDYNDETGELVEFECKYDDCDESDEI